MTAFKPSGVEYRTMKQYRTLGEALDKCKVYGYRAAVEEMLTKDAGARENGHEWLTTDKEPGDEV